MRTVLPENRRTWKRAQPASLLAAAAIGAIFLLQPAPLRAQDTPKFAIDEDCQAFDISADNSIVYAVPRMKRVKRLIIERDDISISEGPGKVRRIVEADKFMPIPPPAGYVIDSLKWSPDGKHIAVNMTLQGAPPGYADKLAQEEAKKKEKKKDKDKDHEEDREEDLPIPGVGGGRAIALLDDDGREIKVAGAKTRFIEGAVNGTWLADGSTVAYLSGGGPYAIVRVRPSDGQTKTLFEGHTFNTVIWDAKNNRAFAVGDSLSLRGRLTLVQLDLEHERVTEIAPIESYQGGLSLSPSGTKIGYFEDGDTIDVLDLAHPGKPVRVRAGFGRFEWSRDERRVLLKRGPEDRSNILLWVGLYDGKIASILHDLQFRDFRIAPGGESIAVTVPGKRVLKVFPLQ
ncbi:MAG: hypothetical protein LAN36_05950 [Acidobacteriia bacterium]|nr:hypothetical protein [Terriglobia bacterium]